MLTVFNLLFFPVMYFVFYATIKARAQDLGISDEALQDDSYRELVQGKQLAIRSLVPAELQQQYQARMLSRKRFPLVAIILLGVGLTLIDILALRSEEVWRDWGGYVFLVSLILISLVTFLQNVSSHTPQHQKQEGDTQIEFRAFGTLSKSDKIGLLLLIILLFCLIYWVIIDWNRIVHIALVAIIGSIYFWAIAGSYYYIRRKYGSISLNESGAISPFQFVPWKNVLHYRWFEQQRGILFLTDDPRARSPLLILPVPDYKADEVQTLLDDVLPGKREEDVEPALERLGHSPISKGENDA